MTATDEAAFLETIRRDPDNDVPRRVMADFLEERGEQARADFIRVQCDLAKLGPPRRTIGADSEEGGLILWRDAGPDYWQTTTYERGLTVGERVDVRQETLGTKRYRIRHGLVITKVTPTQWHDFDLVLKQDSQSKPWPGAALRRRERELWNFGMPGTWVDGIKPPFDCIQCIDEETISREQSRLPILVYRRGFPAAITLDCGTLCGERCRRCGGGGQVPVYIGHGDHRIDDCWGCSGTGRTPGIAAELGRACPTLERVTVTGKTPSDSGSVWNWYDQDLLDGAFPDEWPHEYGLPHELFVLLGDDIVKTADGRDSGCSTHPSLAAAQNALNAAALRLIRLG